MNLVVLQGQSSTYKIRLCFYGLAINNEIEMEENIILHKIKDKIHQNNLSIRVLGFYSNFYIVWDRQVKGRSSCAIGHGDTLKDPMLLKCLFLNLHNPKHICLQK